MLFIKQATRSLTSYTLNASHGAVRVHTAYCYSFRPFLYSDSLLLVVVVERAGWPFHSWTVAATIDGVVQYVRHRKLNLLHDSWIRSGLCCWKYCCILKYASLLQRKFEIRVHKFFSEKEQSSKVSFLSLTFFAWIKGHKDYRQEHSISLFHSWSLRIGEYFHELLFWSLSRKSIIWQVFSFEKEWLTIRSHRLIFELRTLFSIVNVEKEIVSGILERDVPFHQSRERYRATQCCQEQECHNIFSPCFFTSSVCRFVSLCLVCV